MKSSPVFPKDEAGSGNAVGYNPHDDFSKFLEEARKHANDVIMNSARPSLNSVEKSNIPSESRKKTSQKSWKNTLLLFWWKSEKKKKKKKSNIADNDGTTLEKKKKMKRHSASGPLSSAGKERGRGGSFGGRPMSGPLMSSCFTPTRADDSTEVPYMCLEQQDYNYIYPHRVHNHGPLYKVT